MSKKLFDYIDKVKRGDSKTMKMIAEYNPNEPRYDSALGKFVSGDKTGALSDFVKPGESRPKYYVDPVSKEYKSIPKEDESLSGMFQRKFLDRPKGKVNKNLEDRKTRNYVWQKVLNNRRKGKKDYEGLNTSDIIVAEDKREQLKELNKALSKPIIKTPPKEIKKPVQQVVKKTVQEEIQDRINKRPPNPLKDTIFGTDAYYLRTKGIL
tara:strand:- start:42 stop:668 length:627 start_codon:yes stop_codon:yes gene_type:complete